MRLTYHPELRKSTEAAKERKTIHRKTRGANVWLHPGKSPQDRKQNRDVGKNTYTTGRDRAS